MLYWIFFIYVKKNNNEWNKPDKRYRWRNLHEISGNIPDYEYACQSAILHVAANTVSRLEQKRYNMRRKQIKEASSTARMLRRGSSREVSAASRIGRTAGRPVGRSVGVADSNGRRSVSRLLRGSYVNMETGSWNPVLDSTYDSNQRG